LRNQELEFALPIEIEDSVWIGGNVVINPGVKIGNNSVIGSGSVVTKDIPSHVLAAGNPCRILRPISEEDKTCYYKIRKAEKNG
jgi:maltose O-acetyltransferase